MLKIIAINGLFFILVLLAPVLVCSQYLKVEINQLADIKLSSLYSYDHPHKDVSMECKLLGPDGTTFSVNGFWDGEDVYRIRFALPQVGRWSYHITCDDPNNAGLHDIRDTIYVEAYTGSNPFYSHGWLKVSNDGHYLMHADSLPFFYLGDTAWEITWKSDATTFLEYLADRKRKGFSTIQLVAMTHQNFNFKDNSVTNRLGESFFLDGDFSMLNPRYFDYLDFIVRSANDSGLVVALVPLWASFMELYPTKYPNRLSIEQSLLLGKYLGARYAGSNIIWIIGGDNVYDTPTRKDFWTKFANTIKEATGGGQLMTLHPEGLKASFDYFDNNTDWLDFHMYQSSHTAKADFTWISGSKGYELEPAKPVLNGEACYEDIYHNLWFPQDTTQVMTFRIRPEHVRQASYESMLSGALVGITYGANGVWQWQTDELPGTHVPRFTLRQAWQFPGSTHMGILKEIMTQFKWYTLKPSQNLLVDFKSKENYIPIASSDARIIAYFPQQTDWVSINSGDLSDNIRYFWINPSTGDTTSKRVAASLIKIQPPDTLDWVLIATADEGNLQNIANEFKLHQNYPNPFNPVTTIRYDLPEQSYVSIMIYNILGREIRKLINTTQDAGYKSVIWDGTDEFGRNVGTGIYLYQIRAGNFTQTRKMLLLK